MTGLSQVPGRPPCSVCTCSSTPARRLVPDQFQNNRMAPAKGTTKALTSRTFEAQSHGFRTSCLRFVTLVTSRNARLASGRWSNATGRAFHPQGHNRRFQIHIMSIILLRQASWRNPLFRPSVMNHRIAPQSKKGLESLLRPGRGSMSPDPHTARSTHDRGIIKAHGELAAAYRVKPGHAANSYCG